MNTTSGQDVAVDPLEGLVGTALLQLVRQRSTLSGPIVYITGDRANSRSLSRYLGVDVIGGSMSPWSMPGQHRNQGRPEFH